MANKEQSFKKHAKFILGFHGAAFALLLVFEVWALGEAIDNPSRDTIPFAALGIGALLLFLYTRTFANGNQDRIIRLEERLRMRELLPADMHDRINEFTTDQLVALRFASDAELPELAKRVLAEGISDRKSIKQLVKDWRPDHHRV